jgi:hypothetical protein
MRTNKEIAALFDTFAEDILNERNARPLVIVGAAKADDLLLETLRAYLLPKIAKPNDNDELLEGDTPLSSFSARIKVCQRLGLIDETLFLILDKLRALRNLSAHSLSFDHVKSPVRERVADLQRRLQDRESYKLTKKRYFHTEPLNPIENCQCLLLTICVLLESIHEKVKRTPGNNKTLSIAAK